MQLIKTGQWYWREDELSLVEFKNLTSTDREEYLMLLLGLDEKEISSTDRIILNQYSNKKNNINFFSL
jgi:hypothetical protein